jgi:Protein of unknown function (DUF3102)
MNKPRSSFLNKRALDEHAIEIRRLGKRVISDAIEIGKRLTECKEIAGHGNWLAWLEQEFGWSRQTADNFINVFEVFGAGKVPNFGTLTLSSIYMLCAPSTSPTVRDDIIDRVQDGEKLKGDDVKAEIKAAQSAASDQTETAAQVTKDPYADQTAIAAAAGQAMPGDIDALPDLPEQEAAPHAAVMAASDAINIGILGRQIQQGRFQDPVAIIDAVPDDEREKFGEVLRSVSEFIDALKKAFDRSKKKSERQGPLAADRAEASSRSRQSVEPHPLDIPPSLIRTQDVPNPGPDVDRWIER